MADVTDYACPECGYDGPHPVLNTGEWPPLVECGDTACAAQSSRPIPGTRSSRPSLLTCENTRSGNSPSVKTDGGYTLQNMINDRAGLPVVLYARISDSDERSRSIPEQLTELRKWAEREQWEIVAEHSDDGISASRYAHGKERDGWEAVLSTLATGRVRALLVWETSRATRNLGVYSALEQACRTYGVLYGYGSSLYDLAKADDSFTVGIGVLQSAHESAKISERTQRAVNGRAAEGEPHGSVAFGYQRVISPKTGRTVGRTEDPETGPIVRELVRRVLDGEPCEGIASDLNRRGVRTSRGNAWRGSNISKIVNNPTYAGFRVQRGKVLDGVTGTWDPLISVTDHYRLRAKFNDPERDKFRHPGHVRYLGTGIYRCGQDGCEGRMRSVAERTGVVHYDCSTCHKGRRAVAAVDDVVNRSVVARLQATEIAPADDDGSAAEAVALLQAELADARGMLEAGDLSLTDFSAWRKGWQARMNAADSTARPSAAPGEMYGVTDRASWDALSILKRREIVAFLAEVTIMPKHRRGEPFDPELVQITWT